MTPTQLRRERALGRPVLPGFRVCRACRCTRPEATFLSKTGSLRTRCACCYLRTRNAARYRVRLRRYYKTPEGRRHRNGLRQAFMARRPLHESLYQFRLFLDRAWASGKFAVRHYLTQVGYIAPSACTDCGRETGVVAFWPDYSKPCTWIRVCSVHRKTKKAEDTRTVAQVNSQLLAAHALTLEVRQVLRTLWKPGS